MINDFTPLEYILTSSEVNKATNGNPVAIVIFIHGNNSHSVILKIEYANTKANVMV